MWQGITFSLCDEMWETRLFYEVASRSSESFSQNISIEIMPEMNRPPEFLSNEPLRTQIHPIVAKISVFENTEHSMYPIPKKVGFSGDNYMYVVQRQSADR